ncbi:MAG TPA: MFS transporter [Candidatus Limnocylindrales bacterium]|nr:MFS transporter [Candidatus Limnocylindrales bacterium]
MAESVRPMGNRDVLRLPEFRKIFAAQAVSDVGDGMTFMALLLLVNELTHSPAALAVLSIAVAVPSMIGGVIAGAYADRLDRRRIMIVSDIVRAGLVLGFVVVGTIERLPILYVVAFLQAAIGTLFSPARGALIPRIVPREGLMAASALAQLSRMIGGLIGTGLTGVIIATTGSAWPAFVLDAATFLVSAAIVLRVAPELGRVPEAATGQARQGVRASAVEGLKIIGRSPTLLATVVGLAIAMLGLGAVNVLFVPFLIDVLRESAAWAGPLEAAQVLSMVLASGVVAGLATRATPQAIMVGSLLGVGVGIALLSAAPNAPAVLLIMFVVGWFVTPAQAATQTILLTTTADDNRGRVLGAFQASMSTTTILSTAAAGVFASIIGVRTVLLAGGLICLGAAIVTALLFRADRAEEAVGAERTADDAAPADHDAARAAASVAGS